MRQSVPALAAKSKSSSACTNDGLAKADAAVVQMPDGDNKTKAMQEMTAAKSSMTQQDMAGCAPHERRYEDVGDEAEEDVTKASYPRRAAALRRAFLVLNARS
jgi:hypothetical protein